MTSRDRADNEFILRMPCAIVCCGKLRCGAVCCSVLQCVAVCCSVQYIVRSSCAFERQNTCYAREMSKYLSRSLARCLAHDGIQYASLFRA